MSPLLLAEVVDVGALLQTALAALLAGVGITLAFSLAIVGMTRGDELQRDGRGAAAVLATGLGVAALLISLAAVALGLVVMIDG